MIGWSPTFLVHLLLWPPVSGPLHCCFLCFSGRDLPSGKSGHSASFSAPLFALVDFAFVLPFFPPLPPLSPPVSPSSSSGASLSSPSLAPRVSSSLSKPGSSSLEGL